MTLYEAVVVTGATVAYLVASCLVADFLVSLKKRQRGIDLPVPQSAAPTEPGGTRVTVPSHPVKSSHPPARSSGAPV